MRIDKALLRRQAQALAEIQDYLEHGNYYDTADYWHEALEGVLNLLAALDQPVKTNKPRRGQ